MLCLKDLDPGKMSQLYLGWRMLHANLQSFLESWLYHLFLYSKKNIFARLKFLHWKSAYYCKIQSSTCLGISLEWKVNKENHQYNVSKTFLSANFFNFASEVFKYELYQSKVWCFDKKVFSQYSHATILELIRSFGWLRQIYEKPQEVVSFAKYHDEERNS